MAKQLNVNVAVTADTSAAKAQLQQLQTTLNQLSNNSANLHIGLNPSEIAKISTEIDKLSIHLKNATNVNTGTLDFSKLNASIKASGSTLQDYGNQLLKLGPQGQQAFSQLTSAIAKSEVPISRVKGLLGEFGTVLTNTVRWQAASSAIHGMMGSIQHAFSYAQQLNKSLNNIQIVTQASDEYMAKFAENANKAAKQLSTTTTQYTNASLIYYQQGLSDKEVAARTEATIKMANASGQSAEKVSNQMTAIWNNFAQGSTNLEYYADVITALGAATASSSEEIATGLQKFAAVADTVGLSYENATAALATITATTRQSADTVGTGLRTLFSRLQSLNLGETLDDGVTLTKYSKALETIGVKVLDATGNLRQMDDILADMGVKWSNLTDAQKTATAQTVGGVRQYTTIMALMENFDEYQKNLTIAKNSTGAVQAQADIYAKSWEAAQKRVKAASESLYSDLIDDRFFIALNNGFAGFLNLLDQIIDGFGGLKAILPGIGALLTNLFSGQISNGLVNFATTISSLAPGAAGRESIERDKFLDAAARSMLNISQDSKMNSSQAIQYEYAKNEIDLQRRYATNQAVMSTSDRQLAQMQLDRYSNLRNQYSQNELNLQKHTYAQGETRMALRGQNLFANNPTNFGDWLDKDQKKFDQIEAYRRAQGLSTANAWFNGMDFDSNTYWEQAGKGIDDFTKNIDQLQNAKNVIDDFGKSSEDSLDKLIGQLETFKDQMSDTDFEDIVEKLESGITDEGKITDEAKEAAKSVISEIQEEQVTDFANAWGFNREAVASYKDEIIACNGSLEKQKQLAEQIKNAQKEASEAVSKQNKQIQTAQNITNLASGVMSVTTAATTASSAINNMMEQGKKGALSFSSVITGGLLPTLMSVMTSISAIDKLSKVSFLSALPIGPIVAGIMAIVAAVTIIDQLTESEDERLERLTTEAEDAKTAADEAQSAYDNLISNRSTHNELIEELDRMINKTNEFRATLEEANAVARDIINENGLIYGKDYYYDQDSIIRFNEGVLDNAETQRTNYKNRSALISSLADYQSNYATESRAIEKELDAAYEGMAKNAVDNDSEYKNAAAFANRFYEEVQRGLSPENFQGENYSELAQNFLKDINLNNAISYDDWQEKITQAIATYGGSYNGDLLNVINLARNSAFANTAMYNYSPADFEAEMSNFLGSQSTSVQQALTKQSTIGQGQYSSILSSLAYLNDNEVSNEENLILDYLTKNYNGENTQQVLADSLKELNEAGITRNSELEDIEAVLDSSNGRALFNGKDFNIDEFKESDAFKQATNQNKALYDYIAKNLQLEAIEKQLQDQINNGTFKNADKIIEALAEDVTDHSLADMRNYSNELFTNLQSQGAYLSAEEIKYIGEHANALSDEAKKNAQNVLTSFFGLEDDGKTPIKQVDDYLNISLKNWNQAKSIAGLGDLFKDNLKDNDFAKQLGEALFDDKGNFNTKIAEKLSTVDLTSSLSALFDLKHLSNTFGDIYNDFYTTALEKSGGESGVFSSIFEAEDFQKELKKVQKEFKKTGKVSVQNVEDIASSCEDLNDALDLNVISAGTVADAIYLYSEGAIESIDDITNELWRALDVANSLQDGLRNAFNFIDNWNPDRSVKDIGDFFGKTSKDYFGELGNGTVGSNRLYQTAQMLWGNGTTGQNYTNSMMNFFLGQEGKNYDPYTAQALYKQQFGQFDNVWTQVQKDGHLGAYWNFLLDSNNNTAIKNALGLDNISEKLKDFGITQGNNGAINISTGAGMTTKQFTEQLAELLGLSPEMAEVYAQELIGHSAGARFDLESADIMAGWDQLQGKNKSDLDRALYGEANKSMLSTMDQQYNALKEKYDNGTLTNPAEQERFNWLQEHNDQIKAAIKAYETYDSAVKKVNDALKDGTSITAELTDEEEKLIKEKNKIGTVEEKVTWDNGEEGSTTKNVYGAGVIGKEVIETEEDFEQAKKAAEDLGGTFGQVMSDGSVVTAEAGESLEDFQKKVKNTEKEIKTSENKQLGKDLFQGIIDAIKELDPTTLDEQIKPVVETINELAQAFASLDGSEESIQALTTAFNELAKLPTIVGDGSTVENLQNLVLVLDKINGTEFKLDISTSLSTEEISHLAKDFDDMYAKRNIEISIKIIDDASVQQFKGDKQGIKSTLEALNKAAQINLKINGLDTLGQQVQAAIDAINATNPTVHVKLDEDQPGGQQGGKGPSEKSDSSRSTVDTEGPSTHSGSSKATVDSDNGPSKHSGSSKNAAQTEVQSTAKITKVDASAVEPVEIKAEPQFQKNGSRDQSMKVQVLPVVEEGALEEIAKPVNKDVTLNRHSEAIDGYLSSTGYKKVNLLIGDNEPKAAIEELPKTHELDMEVHVTVGISSAFGGMTLAGGAGIIGGMGPSIQAVASGAVLGDSRVQSFIEETRKHYTRGQEGCQYSEGTCRDGGPTGGTATGSTIYHSYVNGSANRYSKPGISLTAEEGPEIVWNKQEGYAYIVGGEGHPEFVNLQPGDRIFNANDTRQILNYNRPKSNTTSSVKDPREMSDTLFGSHATGSAYGSYGPQSTYGNRGGRAAGGKGGSSKEFKPERYHLITRQIQDLTFWYEELKKARENAYGVNVLRSIDKEIAATDELVKANRALLDEVDEYLTQDLAKLNELGINAEFDSAGNILNFEELEEKYKKKADEEKDEDAQKAWDAITQYEETLDKMQEVRAEISDQLYDYAELRLEKINVKAEMRIDFDDREIKFVQHFLDKIDDDIYKSAEAFTHMGKQMELINDKILTTHQSIDDIFANMVDRYGNPINITYEQWLNMSAAEREALDINGNYGKQLEENADSILDYIESLQDYKKKGVEKLIAAFDELNEKVNAQVELFSHYSGLLSSIRDIADLQGIRLPKDFRNVINQLNNSMISVAKNTIKTQQEQYQSLAQTVDELTTKINNTTDEALKKDYQKKKEDIEKQMRDLMNDTLSTYQDALNTAKSMFDSTMEWIKEDYGATMSDIFDSTNLLQDAFDRRKTINEQYVDDYEKYYQLGKLERSIMKDLDQAAINGNKQNKNLKALLEDIHKLQQDGTELSAYDLDILAKRYEYEKALADLEDARNAKQIVRLQRDRNGNWGYVYTAADGDELADQEQAVEDKLYEYTKTATERSHELESEIMKLWTEAGEKVAQMWIDGASPEAIADVLNYYKQRAEYLTNAIGIAADDAAAVLDRWQALTNDKFNLTTDTFGETILSMLTGISTAGDVSEKILKAIGDISTATKAAIDDYNINIEMLNRLVSGNSSNFADMANQWSRMIEDASKKVADNAKVAMDELNTVFTQILKQASDFEKMFMDTYEPIIKRNEEFLAGLIKALAELNKVQYNTAPENNPALAGNTWSPASFDTGGFTGSWGPDGKLAFLHEQEEVFNKHDTANLLQAANILRTLDMQTGSFEKGLGDFFSPNVKDNSQIFEQNVNITAEFPNATNHSEIEEAFNNLANRATQYANRKVG